MVAQVVVILAGGKVTYLMDGEVSVEVIDCDNDPKAIKRVTKGLQRLMRDIERTEQ